MAFRATVGNLQTGFQKILSTCSQQKAILQSWNTKLSGNITGLDAIAMTANLKRVIADIDEVSALPGMAAYAQTQFGDQNYNVAAEFTTMRAALVAVQNWLKTNIPANAVYVSSGDLAGLTYAPAATASLRSLVVAAEATIS